jgi:hypothetical protein
MWVEICSATLGEDDVAESRLAVGKILLPAIFTAQRQERYAHTEKVRVE